MRYVLAAIVAFVGAVLLGLAVHNHVDEAWKVLST